MVLAARKLSLFRVEGLGRIRVRDREPRLWGVGLGLNQGCITTIWGQGWTAQTFDLHRHVDLA